MIKFIYAFKDKIAGFYRDPCFSPLDVEHYKDQFIQGSFYFTNDTKDALKNCELYCLGTYDNVKCHFELKHDYILDCAEVISLADKAKTVNVEALKNEQSKNKN